MALYDAQEADGSDDDNHYEMGIEEARRVNFAETHDATRNALTRYADRHLQLSESGALQSRRA